MVMEAVMSLAMQEIIVFGVCTIERPFLGAWKRSAVTD